MADDSLGWFQMGGNIVASGRNFKLQQQQLKAQEAARAVQERLLAAQIAQTDLENQKLQADITRRAQEDAQWLQVNTDIAKRKLVFDNALEMANSGGLIKDPAAIQQPDWQGMRKQAAFELAQQGNSRAQEVVKSELAAESAMALARQREASTKLSEARTAALTQDPDDFTQRAKALGLEPSGIDAQGRTTFARPRTSEEMIITPEGVTIKKGVPSATERREALSNDEALASLNDAITAIQKNPTAIGVRGIVGQAIEQARGQISPTAQFDTSITDTRQKASLAFSRIAKSLRVDSGNMSKYELNRLEQAGDVLGAEEATQTALTKFYNLRAVVIGRQLRTLKQQRKQPDAQLLSQIPPSDFVSLAESELLSVKDIVNASRLKLIDEATALKAFHALPE